MLAVDRPVCMCSASRCERPQPVFLFRDDFRSCAPCEDYPLNLMCFSGCPEVSQLQQTVAALEARKTTRGDGGFRLYTASCKRFRFKTLTIYSRPASPHGARDFVVLSSRRKVNTVDRV